MSHVHPAFANTLTPGMDVALDHVRWTRPDNYVGPDHDGYVVAARHRDSAIVDEVNWDAMREDLQPFANHLQLIHDSHHAVGWIEFILLPTDAPKKAKIIAASNLMYLDDHVSLDDDELLRREAEEVVRGWNDHGLDDAVNALARKLSEEEEVDDAEEVAEAAREMLDATFDRWHADGRIEYSEGGTLYHVDAMADELIDDASMRYIILSDRHGNGWTHRFTDTSVGFGRMHPSHAAAWTFALTR